MYKSRESDTHKIQATLTHTNQSNPSRERYDKYLNQRRTEVRVGGARNEEGAAAVVF
jgi:hypothetical protein